jgi:hypothetical protein
VKKWFQKTIAITVAFLTFGVITPNHEIWAAFDTSDKQSPVIYSPIIHDVVESYQLDELLQDEHVDPIGSILEAAKEQSYIKFGSKVSPIIENEFEQMIYPKMAEAIQLHVASLGSNLAITAAPSGDYKEKIFNIYNVETKRDVMRFHVRVENRPFEGHYYNFHYHLADDQFVKHYNLGDIFWSKNMPPKWLS